MQLISTLLIALSATSSVLAQTTTPACIQSCFTTSPVSSQCNGDETGAALSTCTCNSLRGSNLLTCVNRCSEADRSVYAGRIPESCRSELFPGLAVASTSSSTVVSVTSTGVTTNTVTATSSRSGASTNSPSATAGPGSSGAVSSNQAQWVLAFGSFLGFLAI